MALKGYPITFNIYAESEQEAERGRLALIRFIEVLRQQNAPVRGDKLNDAVGRMSSNPFVANQIINFFKQ